MIYLLCGSQHPPPPQPICEQHCRKQTDPSLVQHAIDCLTQLQPHESKASPDLIKPKEVVLLLVLVSISFFCRFKNNNII